MAIYKEEKYYLIMKKAGIILSKLIFGKQISTNY